MRVFYNAPTDVYGLGVFVTEVTNEGGVLKVPTTILDGDYGDRKNPAVAQPLDLTVKVFVDSHPSGDFLFEAPLLGPDVPVTNTTTALLWLLKWGFTNPSLKISQNAFSSMVTSVELICQSCRTQTSSQVLAFIQSRSDLVAGITQILARENPSLTIAYNWVPEAIYYAWSTPVLTTNGYGTAIGKQQTTVSANVIAVNPLNSSTKIQAANWVMTRADGSTATAAGSPMIYTFTNEDQVMADFAPTFTESVDFSSRVKIHFEVGRANRAPECDEPIQLTMKANRINTAALTSYCRDIDNPAATPNLGVTYALVSGPAGMTISTAGVVRWSPGNALAGSNYPFQVLVTTSTSANHVAQGKIMVNAVQIPVFASTLTGAFIEGASSDVTIPITNPEGDPLLLTVKGVGTIRTGFPTGAGVLSNWVQDKTDPQNPIITWSYIPSYLQGIGEDTTITFTYSLRYDTATDPNLDGSVVLATQTATFPVTNADDPPEWISGGTDTNLKEGTAFSLVMGKALDPSPNPTAITYTFSSTNGRCDWSDTASLSINGSGEVVLSGYPAYTSRDECSFQVTATDANGLSSKSDAVTFAVEDTNRAVTEITSPDVAEVAGTENLLLQLPVDEMFTDPDITDDDSRESLSWACQANTTALGDPYVSTCSAFGLNFSLSRSGFSGSWMPQYGNAGTYYVKLTVTDAGGNSASHAFKLVIASSPAPMILKILQNDIEVPTIVVNEGQSSVFVLRAISQSVADVNQYTYNVSSPSCYVSGGMGTCRAAMIVSPGSLEGHGTQDFLFTISPNYTDGDVALPGTSKNYIVSFNVVRQPGTSDNETPSEIANDTFTLETQISVGVTINNTNRAPTAIGLAAGSYGCTGSSANSSSSAFTICINLAQNTKSGNTWQKTYTNQLTYTDPDLTNDSYTLAFTNSGVPGTIASSTNLWTIKLPSCLNAGTSTISRTYSLTLSDGRGGTISRDVIVKFQNGSAASSCM
ncbi:hypothetical protein ACLSU7_18505 [Bdellovibrio sp. HCB185ZH]|uniref:hypothetical protein n=1 Tax=Bdellovibrio sp. HCB185ZH TaxID=3394235 RepID=UPI0039A50C7E